MWEWEPQNLSNQSTSNVYIRILAFNNNNKRIKNNNNNNKRKGNGVVINRKENNKRKGKEITYDMILCANFETLKLNNWRW
jgi:hypothetical protein